MRDHIGLGEITGRIELLREFVEEAHVEIDLAVAGAIERPGGGRSKAAGRTHLATKEHHLRLFILLAVRLEDAVPGVFGLGKHRRHELLHFLFLSRALRRWRAVALLEARHLHLATAAFQHLQHVYAHGLEDEVEDDEEDDRAEAHAAAGAPHATATGRHAKAATAPERISAAGARAALVFDIVGLAAALPFHDLSSRPLKGVVGLLFYKTALTSL